MARKRKSAAEAANVCPRDLNEIPYIAWMNKQLSAGRKPSGPQPVGTPSRGDTSYQAPRDVPTRGRRDADWVASSRSPEVNTYGVEDDDADYNEEADGTDDEADSREEDDKGMSDSDAIADGDDTKTDDEDAPEESQPATPPVCRGPAKAAPGVKNAAKGGEPPRRAPKIRDPMPVKRSPLESTILVAARWFTKDELEPLLGKQGSQYWARLVRHLEAENPGWVRGVNAVQKQWRNLVSMFKQLQKADKASGNGVVSPACCTDATMAAAKLVSDTIKGCHADAMAKLEGLVCAWMQQDAEIARARNQGTTPLPPTVSGVPVDQPRSPHRPPRKATVEDGSVAVMPVVSELVRTRPRKCGFVATPSKVRQIRCFAEPLPPFTQCHPVAWHDRLPFEICNCAAGPPRIPVPWQVCPRRIDAPHIPHRLTHVVQDYTTKRPYKHAP
ncbi:unnamed protein product [Closterium sp. NIES-65]|nr:unnamed protein product [Closterium sp. NIES-65]